MQRFWKKLYYIGETIKMKNKIKIKSVVIISLICLISAAGYAYMADIKSEKVNKVRAGNNDIEIVEIFERPRDDVKANTDIKKIVRIKNGSESVECYVRCFAEFTDSDTEKMYDVDYNTKDWEKSGDYWYYKRPLAKGEITEPLQTRVRTKKDGFPVFEQILYAESVQKEGYSNAHDAFASISS